MYKKLKKILGVSNPKSYSKILRKHHDILKWLDTETAKYNPANLSEKIYIVLEHAPRQQPCGRYPVFDSFTKGYKTFCGSKQNCECARKNQSRLLKSYHSTKDPKAAQQSLKKQQQTCLERYGATNPAKNQTIREKIKKTNQIRYNADFPFQSKQIQHKIETTNLGEKNCNKFKKIRCC